LKDKAQIKLKLDYLIYDEDETKLELIGKLHRS